MQMQREEKEQLMFVEFVECCTPYSEMWEIKWCVQSLWHCRMCIKVLYLDGID